MMKKKDVILIVVILLIAAAGMGAIRLTQQNGAQVIVTVDGEEVYRTSLKEDQVYEIPVKDGENVMEIQDGEVTMRKADCPDQICKNHKPIRKSGETIVCLPHKAVIEISSEEDESEMDGITR
nr:NusG domain II-containing protein [uncultured Anaerostipes sp.]